MISYCIRTSDGSNLPLPTDRMASFLHNLTDKLARLSTTSRKKTDQILFAGQIVSSMIFTGNPGKKKTREK